MEKKIRITCDANERLIRLPLVELNEIQGGLKEMTKENFVKLRRKIIDRGFKFPMIVWRESVQVDGKIVFKTWIVDGHGRKKVLQHLINEEGFDCPSIPCVEIEADSWKEARKEVLNVSSHFNTMTNQGLYEFMEEGEMEPEELDDYVLTEIDSDEFKMEFYDDSEPDVPEADKETVTFDAYKNAAVKQVVLYYAAPEYETMVRGLDRLMKDLGVEDYSQVLWRLVDEALRAKS